ncbi:DUF1643 domain-containing protein [Corynebacterium sp. CCM 9185]|uniref:DUF1643 domain-containing protein n=1 Tax=Corynebacterium marambiense TaxID=2765364 RepID=A0ABS0VU12_9CORY|nr:hypothetical protein [Corynebacterium marambiense]MBI9000271.1 hypothetical protein [Corynebacterium marambiense]MCK7663625.1 DUF1643 domain-containing protein [Corynebacterium marambiense]MCX7541941.1 hypothetical protein [Corynebacterium marambiense]
MSNNTAKSIEECIEEIMRSDEEHMSVFASEEELQEGKAHIEEPSDYRLPLSWNRNPGSTKKEEEKAQILFIGMNPSSATKFDFRKRGGDPTTGILRQLLNLDNNIFPEIRENPENHRAAQIIEKVDRAILINLSPIIGSRSELENGIDRWKITPPGAIPGKNLITK